MKNLPILFCCLSVLSAFGQSDYYITDSAAIYDVELLDEGEVANAQFCHLNVFDKTKKLSPEVVSAYGFEEGPRYKSYLIDIGSGDQWVFLEVLLLGELGLYAYETDSSSVYFIERYGELSALPSGKGFKYGLMALMSDFEPLKPEIERTNYERSDLIHLFESYNHRRLAHYPKRQIGLLAGLDFQHWSAVEDDLNQAFWSQINFEPGMYFTSGLFVEEPFDFLIKGFSAYIEGRYTFHRQRIQQNLPDGRISVDIYADLHQLQVPFFIRYKPPFKRFRPFIAAGVLTTGSFAKEYHVLATGQSFGGNYSISSLDDKNSFNPLQYAYGLGIGFETNINLRNCIIFELRYNRQSPLLAPFRGMVNQSSYQIFVAYAFN